MTCRHAQRATRLRFDPNRSDALRHAVMWLIAACALIAAWPVLADDAPDPYASLVAQTDPLTPAEQQKKFHLPPGFTVELVAAEPDIQKPMNLNFDAQGRLYVTHSVEYPYPAAEDATPRDGLSALEDTNGDGKYDRVIRYADELNIPIGVVPIADGVLVHSIPAIYHLRDADGDGQADEREQFYATFGSRDTHGMTNSFTRWIDGWIYATHGFSNTSQVEGSDEASIEMSSGNTYRMRPDGSHVEYFTHGQVNPFGLCFDPLGNLYSSDCHTKPIYMLLRGAWYPSFGKPHDGMGFGPEMIDHLHGSTGIAGVVYYAANQFPEEYRGTVFIGNPVTGRVNHDRLEAHGSTYEAIELPDFVACDDPWFRPVDLKLGLDGALYIADFYNAVIGHYEVPLTHPRRDRHRGRIWRVVYTGKNEPAPPSRVMPDLTQLKSTELIEKLGDANLTVRTLATHELYDRFGTKAVEPLRNMLTGASSSWQRVHAMWILARLNELDDGLTSRLAGDFDRAVRTHLCKVLAEKSEWTSTDRELALAKLTDADPFVRRAAADALDRHPLAEQMAPLVDLWKSTDPADTHLIHVVRMALRDHLLVDGVYANIESLVSDRPEALLQLADVSLGVPSAESAAFLLKTIAQHPVGRAELERYLHHATRYIADDQLPSIFAYAEIYDGGNVDDQLAVLRAMDQGLRERGAEMPEPTRNWAVRLANDLLTSESADDVRRGIELARELQLVAALDQLLPVAGPQARFGELRSTAIEACIQLDRDRAMAVVEAAFRGASEPVSLRQHAATMLGSVNTEQARGILLGELSTSPESLAVRIAENLAGSPEGAKMLLATISEGKASPRLLMDINVNRRLQSHKLPDLDEHVGELTTGLPPVDERIEQLIAVRRERFHAAQPDAGRGAEVFKKTCAACHRIAGEGNKIGPELDGVGLRGLDRLLEDVLDPSRNVDQAFRATLVTTTDGRVIMGLALRDEGNVLVLADAEGKEVRLSQDEIDEREVGNLSPMPNNVPELLSPEDFSNLLAFLLTQKQQPKEDANTAVASKAPKPNVVFILADDLGYTDVACYGSQYYETPHIDALAAAGMRFTDGYTCGPNCQPTRAALMSGQYGPRTGVYTVGHINRFNWQSRSLRPVDNAEGLPPDKITIAQAMKSAGYATGMFGKWHLGNGAEAHPSRRGFDEAIVSAGKHFDFNTRPNVDVPPGTYLADFLTDRAVDFIRRHNDEPFFLYLPHFGVHSPYQAKDDLIAHFKPKPPAGGHHDPTYAAMIASVDESVGRIVAVLDELGLSENTLVIFSSDNGGVGGYTRAGIKKTKEITDNAPLRGGKGMLAEGGIRVPFVFRCPGMIEPGSTCQEPINSVDLYPTLLELAEAEPPVDYPLDGTSYATLLTGEKSSLERDAIFWHFPGYLGAGADTWRTTPVGVIRSGDWKLLEYFEDGHLELYNLSDDIGESKNLVDENPDKAKRLHASLREWREEIGAPMPQPITEEDKSKPRQKSRKKRR